MCSTILTSIVRKKSTIKVNSIVYLSSYNKKYRQLVCTALKGKKTQTYLIQKSIIVSLTNVSGCSRSTSLLLIETASGSPFGQITSSKESLKLQHFAAMHDELFLLFLVIVTYKNLNTHAHATLDLHFFKLCQLHKF